MTSTFRHGWLAIIVLLLATAVPHAQSNTAEISGTVRDAQGAVLPGATVSAVHTATGTRLERVTDQGGRFLLPSLRVGEYEITVELPGFKRLTRPNVIARLGEVLALDLGLEVGGVTEQVTVTTELPAVQLSNAEQIDRISNEQVVQLPLNGRQFLQLALLTDNVVVPPGGTRGSALQQAGSLFNVAGQRSGHNIYLLDGVKVTDEYFNNMVVSLSPEAIEEFTIRKSQYPAEFGGKAAALVNVSTRSGANQFRGTVVEFVRNSAFDAHNYFDNPNQPVPPLRQNQFGASLGGPIRRQQTFFFAAYEGQRVNRSTTQTFSVPTAAMRSGNFAGGATLCDPTAAGAASGCVPFANNQIPAAQIDPIARALLAEVPLPTSDGSVQNLSSVGKQTQDMNQFSLRLDHRLSSNDQLFGRFTAYGVTDNQPFGTSTLNETLVPGFGRIVTTKSRNLALGHTHTFTANLLNEVRFGYLRAEGGQFSQNEGIDFAASTGLRGVTGDPRDVGYPQVSFAGLYNTIGDPTTFTRRKNDSFEIYDNVLLNHGRHTIKFGVYLFRLQFRPESPDNARGSFTYTGQFTGNALGDFLLGYPTQAVVGIGRAEEDARTTWFHMYGQDDFRVTDSLTFNVGLRAEINTHMDDTQDRLSTVDPNFPGGRFVIASDDDGNIAPEAQALLAKIPIPYTTSAAAGWDSSLVRPGYKRFAPRLGFVWRAPLEQETVVRGAFGIFLNQWAYSVQQAFARNLPFFYTQNVNIASDVRVPTQTTSSILTTDAPGTVGASIMDWDYRVEYNQTYTLDVQHLLAPRTTVELSLMASRTVGADSSTVRNVPQPGPGNIAARRPIPQLGTINAIRWDGYGLYHSLTGRIVHRMFDGMSLSANYTWSKSIDDASDPGGTVAETNLPQDPYNMKAEKALSSYDHRHRAVVNGTYQLPFLRGAGGWQEALGGNWRVSAIMTLESGAPFTVNLGTDRANVGAGPAQRPNLLRNPNLPANQRTPQRWFDTDAFELPAQYTYGNAGRNIVFGPGYASVDAVLQKDVPVGNRRLELRWEVFNLLNRTNFSLPNRIAFTPNFGRIFSASNPRQMQFGGRFSF